MKRSVSILLTITMFITLFAGRIPAGAAGKYGVTDNENEAAIYRYLTRDMGFNNAVASGILANIYLESRFDPNAAGDSGTSYGICQWHNSRWEDLKSYCEKQGYDWQTLEGQLHFLEYELNKDYASLITNLEALHNTDYGCYRAAYYWTYQFERPAGYRTGMSEERGEYARDTFWPVYCGDDYESASEWTSDYPTDIDEDLIETWDEYRRRDYVKKTTNEAGLEGWELLESGWTVTESGSISYVAEWPEGFDRTSTLYEKYNQTPKTESATDKKIITASYQNGGWIYYHWCGENGEISASKTESAATFHAFISDTAPEKLESSTNGDGSYIFPDRSECSYSNCYFALAVTKQTYEVSEYLYTYGRWGDWGSWLDWNVLVEKALKKVDPESYKIEFRSQYRYIIKPVTVSVELLRIAGSNRVETAAAVSENAFQKADSVIIASGNAFPDALAGGVLAYALKAPILLVRNKLESAVQDEITRLGAKNIYILGGTAAVSDAIETELKKLGSVTRIKGGNRYETAVKIAEKTEEITGTAPTSVFFASAESYADAISASTVSALLGMPVLYVSRDGTISSETQEYLAKHNIERATILGGYSAVSEQAEENLRAMGVVPEERLMGEDRYETCLEILRQYESVLTGEILSVATGLDYPDALTGAVYAAVNRSPLMIVGRQLTEDQKAFLTEHSGEKLTVFGGEASAVSKSVTDEVMYAMSLHE